MNPVRFAVLALLLSTPPAHAGARVDVRSIDLQAPPAQVQVGDVVTLHWVDPGPLAEEMEILLSVDGGRTYPLRVSPELDPRAGSYRWRVPDLPAAGACLRVRLGHGRDEWSCAPTAAFRIVAGGADAGACVHEAGWWERAGAERGGAAGSLDRPGERFEVLSEDAAISEDDNAPRLAGLAPLDPATRGGTAPERVFELTRACTRAAHPGRFPLRN